MRGLFLSLVGGLFFLFGCTSVSVEDRAVEIITAYQKARFELTREDMALENKDDIYPLIEERVKPYLTEKVFQNSFFRNRDGYYIVASAKMNHTLRIKEIRIKELVAADNNTSFSIDYTLVVEIISSDTKKVITNELPAQVTIVKEGDTWKIDRYWESIKAGDLDM
ncbi:hypothetical protein BRE01_46440 [Brevibacillus reuszeri]|uniref:Uncharacterized protein n=1 Tax=Brevibacillus reuszeri TaxID=54915 RepID=A0A0K9YZC5_9BACL|nr:hypothetical protein [Brevibacillus reuszeri]KNB73972.1 hypothetical protein ADS79_08605 [Brevibacillus reuszeri]MED1859867.1 hypothetical protein [Brevibacillus reuszeri]GED70942.1 hypothetical protein BRE01_46440 [Brevibacillus reuszeri]